MPCVPAQLRPIQSPPAQERPAQERSAQERPSQTWPKMSCSPVSSLAGVGVGDVAGAAGGFDGPEAGGDREGLGGGEGGFGVDGLVDVDEPGALEAAVGVGDGVGGGGEEAP